MKKNPFLEKDPFFRKKLQNEFKEIEKNSREKQIPFFETNNSKNRYVDVIPFKNNIVKLKNKEYINASFICYKNCYQKYIATQAPLENTISDFWEMIFEQEVEFIIMLCNSFPRRCDVYWPENNEKIKIENLVIETVFLTETSSLSKRKILLTNILTKDKKVVIHFHYKEWDDRDIPKNMKTLEELLNQLEILFTDTPIVVHCSAGCGRTGTFCAIDTIRKIKTEEHNETLLFDIISVFREQRHLMVQTSSQYVFIFDFISFYLYKKTIY